MIGLSVLWKIFGELPKPQIIVYLIPKTEYVLIFLIITYKKVGAWGNEGHEPI